ncbi:hypothetical protein [Calothrix sp. PCC 7507]|nr:hypothetical protein [Calothrix sp. PCC 7507]
MRSAIAFVILGKCDRLCDFGKCDRLCDVGKVRSPFGILGESAIA